MRSAGRRRSKIHVDQHVAVRSEVLPLLWGGREFRQRFVGRDPKESKLGDRARCPSVVSVSVEPSHRRGVKRVFRPGDGNEHVDIGEHHHSSFKACCTLAIVIVLAPGRGGNVGTRPTRREPTRSASKPPALLNCTTPVRPAHWVSHLAKTPRSASCCTTQSSTARRGMDVTLAGGDGRVVQADRRSRSMVRSLPTGAHNRNLTSSTHPRSSDFASQMALFRDGTGPKRALWDAHRAFWDADTADLGCVSWPSDRRTGWTSARDHVSSLRKRVGHNLEIAWLSTDNFRTLAQ